MAHRPRIFVSAVSKELHSARQLVANTLQFMGYEPTWQDVFETEQGDLRWMLRRRIDDCHGVLHLVGKCYGAEPPEADEDFGRVSYTQFEALYARQCGKRVWTFIIDDDFPVDEHDPEAEELAQLQTDYRRGILDGADLYYPLQSSDALEASTLKLRQELAQLRRGFKRWAIGVSAALIVLVGLSIWIIVAQSGAAEALEETAENTQRTAEVAEETQRISEETADVASDTQAAVEETADVARDTQAVVEETGRVVGETNETIRRMDTREAREAAAARLQRAVDAMDLANHGQVEAIELLLANGHTFGGGIFNGVALQGANLNGGQFSAAQFQDGDLAGATLRQADLTDATMFLASAPRMDATGIRGREFRLQMGAADEAIFDGANLKQASFYLSHLRGASFRDADCTATSFAFADLTGADFTGADLTDALFIGALIEDAIFTGATFRNTDMSAAMTPALDVTDEQRANMCHTPGLRNYLSIVLTRRWESSRFSTGYEFDDDFPISFQGIPGEVHESLPQRQAGGLEPAGFTPIYPDVRFQLDRDFLDVGDRHARISRRIQAHGDALVAKARALPTVGADAEHDSYMTQLAQNAQRTEMSGSLLFNIESQILLALAAGVGDADDLTDQTWQSLVYTRYQQEWPTDGATSIDENGFVDGWQRLFPPGPRASTPHALTPLSKVMLYRTWTLNRAKAMQAANVSLRVELKVQPRSRAAGTQTGPGLFEPFESAAANDRNGLHQYNDLPNTGHVLPLPEFYIAQQWQVALVLEHERPRYVVELDELLELPLEMSIETQVLSVERVESGRGGWFRQVINLRPVRVTLTDREGRMWSGPVTVKDDAGSE